MVKEDSYLGSRDVVCGIWECIAINGPIHVSTEERMSIWTRGYRHNVMFAVEKLRRLVVAKNTDFQLHDNGGMVNGDGKAVIEKER